MRLTEKDNDRYNVKQYFPREEHLIIDIFAYENCIEKLGQLEDIEDNLGIDLITLFKAIKDGFYTKNARYTGYGMGISITKKCLWNDEWQDDIYYFKDYGKNWALTKEELEKGD